MANTKTRMKPPAAPAETGALTRTRERRSCVPLLTILGLIALCAPLGFACGGTEGPEDASGGGDVAMDGPPIGTRGLGGMCTETSECAAGLYCAANRTCRAAGSGGDGDTCADSGDCLRGYVCVAEPGGMICREAEGRALGDPCIRHDQCAAGLYCVDGQCSAEAPPPPDAGPIGMACSPGTDDCEDSNRCTNDQCVADRCVNTLIDGDEDGYASDIFGRCGLDCCDSDDRVNPEQEAFFAVNHAGNPPLTPANHDWNCDGTQEMEYLSVLPACSSFARRCTLEEGWVSSMPPRCGLSGVWGRCVDDTGICRIETVEAARVQRCR